MHPEPSDRPRPPPTTHRTGEQCEPARPRQLFDFELTVDEMTEITALDKGEDGRTGPHPNSFEGKPS